ncbi:TonB-dependent receptor [Lutimonas sp.]|uniref:TonB-dependent receptor n=1 Tax=Lutimonas sp. TaxID=1872403 RepID=UPI003D9B0EA8
MSCRCNLTYLLCFTVLLFIVSPSIWGQTYQGKVLSAENKLELQHAQILDSLNGLLEMTDQYGEFTLTKSGKFTCVKEGYYPKTFTVNSTGLTIIELEEEPFSLSEVVIKTDNFQSELRKISASIAVIPTTQIKSNNGVNIAPILNTVPGVYMHNGTLNTNRITIRGIGSRNLFGTSKIRAYYGDIPLTNGSGETSIEDIELDGIARMEILKGPSSSLYGAGLGGTIQLIPDKGTFDRYSLSSAYTFGSFGLQKFLLNTNLANKTNAAKVSYSNTKSDGYRDNNELDRQTLTLASNHYLNEKNNLHILANFISLKAYIPSSLNEEDYQNEPTKAAFTWAQSKGFEDYDKYLLGLSWQHRFNENSQQISSIFGSLLDSYEARPFNILEQNTRSLGLRTRFINQKLLFQKKLQWTLGLELFNDINNMKTFENLYRDFPPGTGSVQGDELSNFEENRQYYNLFFEAKYALAKNLLVDFGLNLNQTSYQIEDRFNDDDENQSGNYGFDPILSPKLGLNYQLGKHSMIYATVSHGFSPPKLEETLLPDGLINNDIQPETGWNYEIGSRGKIIQNIFSYEVAIYLMDIDNLLVARRTGDDQFIGVNAGKTTHKGLEIGLNYFLINKPSVQLSHSNSFSLHHYTFDDFKDVDNDYSGNDLTGVPDKTFFSQLLLNSKTGFYTYLNYQYIGEIPLRDDNSIYADSYQIVNLKTGFKKMISTHFQLDLYVGLNNIFDEKYASMLLINAGSFGNNPPRYYYPGEPRNYFAGLNLSYTF